MVRCPAGECPVEHRPTRGEKAMLACFDDEQCEDCFLRDLCPAEPRRKQQVVRFTPADVAVAERRTLTATSHVESDSAGCSNTTATHDTWHSPIDRLIVNEFGNPQ